MPPYRYNLAMRLSDRARRGWQIARIITGMMLVGLVLAIWLIPNVLNPIWALAVFIALGLPGAIGAFVIKAGSFGRA